MSLEIPHFGGTPCRDLTVCAHVEDIDVAVRKKLSRYEDDPLIVHIRAKHCFAFVQTAGRTGNHFHVDLLSDVDADDDVEPTGSAKDFSTRFKIIEGHELQLASDATFSVSIERLPPIVQRTMVATQAGDVSIKVTGGRLSVTGANISRITWWLDGEREASVRLESRSLRTADGMYIQNEFASLCAAFDAFITGGGGHE